MSDPFRYFKQLAGRGIEVAHVGANNAEPILRRSFQPDRSLAAVEPILLAIVLDLLDDLRRVLLRPYDCFGRSDRSAGLLGVQIELVMEALNKGDRDGKERDAFNSSGRGMGQAPPKRAGRKLLSTEARRGGSADSRFSEYKAIRSTGGDNQVGGRASRASR
jgi:hypothetical protein